jgi:glycogen synthase
MEAMAVGLAPVVVDYGGPSEFVSTETGFRLPIGTRGSIVAALRDVLEQVVAAPSLADRLGDAAATEALRRFTWESKAQRMMSVYQWVLGRGPRPIHLVPPPSSAPVLPTAGPMPLPDPLDERPSPSFSHVP